MVWSEFITDSLTLPFGATTGARIVISGTSIIEYDANNNIITQIDPVNGNQFSGTITLPAGATTGARLIISQTGLIEYDSNNNVIMRLDPINGNQVTGLLRFMTSSGMLDFTNPNIAVDPYTFNMTIQGQSGNSGHSRATITLYPNGDIDLSASNTGGISSVFHLDALNGTVSINTRVFRIYNRGYSSAATDINGYINVPHGLGAIPAMFLANLTVGNTPAQNQLAKVICANSDANNMVFLIIRSDTGASLPSQVIRFNWFASL